MGGMAFEYSNLNDRSPGWLFRLLLPGVGLVENEIRPYAGARQERNLAALASADPLWVVLGDSLSQGIGASSVEHGWVPQTQRSLADRGVRYRIVNLSFSGARVSDVLTRQIPALAGLSAAPAVPLHFGDGARAQDHFHPGDTGYAAIVADFTAAILARR
jgi:lysophospholipase L1-like esterase